jgi:hypothetical protein
LPQQSLRRHLRTIRKAINVKLRASHRLTWFRITVVSCAILSVGLLSGCGAEAVKPPVADKGAPGAAPGGVSSDDYAKKMQEMKGGK